MQITCTSVEELRQEAEAHRELKIAMIEVTGYIKIDGTVQDYELIPMKYGVLLDKILATPEQRYIEVFSKNGWEFTPIQIRQKLEASARAREEFLAGTKSITRGSGFTNIGLNMFQEEGAAGVWIKDVIVRSPIKKYPPISTAIAMVAANGYIASFSLFHTPKSQNFSAVTFHMS